MSSATTCNLMTNAGNVITYSDPGAGTPPDGDNVVSLNLGGTLVDLTDASTTYLVSTVNYVAAGSCNFNKGGETIWPLDQIAYDTHFYMRDTVINYVDEQVGPINPAIEGRVVFTTPQLSPAGYPPEPSMESPEGQSPCGRFSFPVSMQGKMSGICEIRITGLIPPTTVSGDAFDHRSRLLRRVARQSRRGV